MWSQLLPQLTIELVADSYKVWLMLRGGRSPILAAWWLMTAEAAGCFVSSQVSCQEEGWHFLPHTAG